jgi:hypothetical protein
MAPVGPRPWADVEAEAPALAAIGRERFGKHLMGWLATVRADGAPRLHPVMPFVTADGRLMVFMEPTSPKGHDLQRDGRYALHCHVPDLIGTQHGEFSITGHAVELTDGASRHSAIEAWLEVGFEAAPERYVLFELLGSQALGTSGADDPPQWLRWRADAEG